MSNNNLGRIEVTQKAGSEPFTAKNLSIGRDLREFWQWFASDLVSNALRGTLAEFIVAMALNETDSTRLEWDSCDIRTKSGIDVEVKSSAYIQTWHQEKHSDIKFTINETKGWNAKTNKNSGELKRYSDVYVFCVLGEKNQEKIDPLNLDQWDFYVVQTIDINERLGNQGNITLGSLKKNLEPVKADFSQLKSAIESSLKRS